MPILSEYAKKKKTKYFLQRIKKDDVVLEIGSGRGWVSDYAKEAGWINYTAIDLNGDADIVGDIKQWKKLGLSPSSYDFIIAFEVVEHVDCFQECHDLLKTGGELLLTTPVPHMDWFLYLLEKIKLTQPRTSGHDYLVYLSDVEVFKQKSVRVIGLLSQWAILKKV